MEIDISDIDFVSLRNDLRDYFGTATSAFPMAMADVVSIDSMSDIELLQVINQTTLNITDYIKTDLKK